MRHLLTTLLIALFAQAGGQPINIPINSPGILGYGQTYSQDLGVTPLQFQPNGGNGFYTLTFSANNPLGNYPGLYEIEFTFGTQKLCDDYKWGTGSVMQFTIVCSSPGYIIIDQALPGGGPVQGAKNLVVTWTVNDGSFNGGWPVDLTNASLTFSPIN